MRYIVTLDSKIDFAPENEVAEILQNVRTIIATVIGSVPMHRALGVSWDFVDAPLSEARIMLKQSIIEAIEDGEPRANLLEIEFEESGVEAMDGKLKPRVIVSIGNDEEDEEI